MFHILGFLFFIILVVLVIGLLILSKVMGMVFGFKRRMQGKNTPVRQRKKIFDKDEGEYVEFEEIN